MLIAAARLSMRARVGRFAALVALAYPLAATAQVAGEWRYTIATDLGSLPADMRVNFPAISFSACRGARDFETGRAFALQTLAGSEARCPSSGFARTPLAGNQGESLRFEFACDDGKTLTGTGQGRLQSTRFSVTLESHYQPAVNGVAMVRQTMHAERIGACKGSSAANTPRTR
jgi:hypothetical protein